MASKPIDMDDIKLENIAEDLTYLVDQSEFYNGEVREVEDEM